MKPTPAAAFFLGVFVGAVLMYAYANWATQTIINLSEVRRSVFGQSEFWARPGTVKLVLSDQVSDGCMPRPSALKDTYEAELRRFQFSVTTDEESSDYNSILYVTALGYETGGQCFVHISVDYVVPTYATVPDGSGNTSTYIGVQGELASALLSGHKDSMQNRLHDKAGDDIRKFFLLVEKNKEVIGIE